MEDELIVKKKMADAVLEEIKRTIESGELKEGAKLPNQHTYTTKLNVSRTSLRGALRMLDLLGVIEQRPGFGTVIKKNSVQPCSQTHWSVHR